MPFTEQPSGYLIHPHNIRSCCWFCGSGRRDIPDPTQESGFRKERVFSTNQFLESDDPGAYELIGMGPAGILAMCESCLEDNARKMLGMITVPEYAAQALRAALVETLAAELDAMTAKADMLDARAVRAETLVGEGLARLADAEAQFATLVQIDAEDAEDAAPLREAKARLEAEVDKLKERLANRDQIISSLRRGQEAPKELRAPGRPRKEFSA